MLKIKPDWFDDWFRRHFEDKPSYSVTDISSALGWRPDRIYRAIHCGDLVAFRAGRRGLVIARDALEDWLVDSLTLNQDV